MLKIILYTLLISCCFSCKFYNQNIMFKTPANIKSSKPIIEALIKNAEGNYLIQKGDHLEVRVYTAEGEEIINPRALMVGNPSAIGQNGQMMMPQQGGGGMMGGGAMGGGTVGMGGGFQTPQFPLDYPDFIVQQTGMINIPKLGYVKVDGLTLVQTDSLLSSAYSKFYEKPFIRTRYNNKRVVVFRGAIGTVLPLRTENMNLIEVLALTGGMPNEQRARNIRLIRGDLKDPDVYVIDLSTMKGVTAQNLLVQPNDIIYVEPVRKAIIEQIGDLSPILSLFTSIITLVLVLRTTR